MSINAMPWSEVSGIFWSCPYVALTAKEIMKVPTFGLRLVVIFSNWILFVCHVLFTDTCRVGEPIKESSIF